MKILYIESKQDNINFNLDKKEIAKLPKKLFLAYSIQYKSAAINIKKQLISNNIKITKFQQVLGCTNVNTQDPILLIGTGRFHALNLYLQCPFIYVLENNKIRKIPKGEIKSLKTKRRTALLKFLSADKIGILVSTKPGQENINLAMKLKQKLKQKNKQIFIFISDNIDTDQFENFKIDSFVNTACSGLSLDSPSIINYNE